MKKEKPVLPSTTITAPPEREHYGGGGYGGDPTDGDIHEREGVSDTPEDAGGEGQEKPGE